MTLEKIREILEMVKFEHTVFALPFAFLGAFLAAGGFPGWQKTFWILLAMAGARSAAMGFNRLADHEYDSLNPRTAARSLPSGRLERSFVSGFVVLSSALFLAAAWNLNRLAFLLSPVALAFVLFYSYTKRFTSLSHLFLGLSLAISPVGGWIAVRGAMQWETLYLAAAVLFWVAGFDIIYACQDVDFDKKAGLYSLPSRLGIRKSLLIARLFHAAMLLTLVIAFQAFSLSFLSAIGIALVAAGILYEHSLVHPDDLSRVNLAFFTMNGIISIVLFTFVGLDLCLYA